MTDTTETTKGVHTTDTLSPDATKKGTHSTRTPSDDPAADRQENEVLGVNPENGQDSRNNPEKDEAETFTREYVEKLRKEAADHRVKAKDRDDLARELFHARVAALGRLADPSDLPFDDALLADMPALEAAVDELLARKPHLASRTPRGDVGQGVSASSETVDLAAILRAGAN